MTLNLFQIYQLKDLEAYKELYLQLGQSLYITVPLLYQSHVQHFKTSVKGQLKQKLQVLKLQANGSTRGQLLSTSADNATCLKRRHVVTVAMVADMD